MKITSCYSCGFPIEGINKIHNHCVKKIFNCNKMPDIDLSLKEVLSKAQSMAGKLSISGVQPKLSVTFSKNENKLNVVSEKGEYILKPQVEYYPHLPENENLCMNIFGLGKVEIPSHTLISLTDGSKAYLIKRFDRLNSRKIHTETFFQILNKKEKYSGSYEEIGKKLRSISDVPGLDVQLFFERIVLNFIIGNGDAHQKNFSIIYKDNNEIRLSPGYDIVSSKLLIPEEEDTALTLNGKKNNIRKSDFIKFADYLKIPDKAINLFIDKKSEIQKMIDYSYLDQYEKERFKETIGERYSRLT
ncbi:MAG: type II toxin-antitoxin system HipA family toxin [bacterium]